MHRLLESLKACLRCILSKQEKKRVPFFYTRSCILLVFFSFYVNTNTYWPIMAGPIPYYTILSASKGQKSVIANGVAASAKPDIIRSGIPVTPGKFIKQPLPLQEPLAYQSRHSSLVPAMNAEKVTFEPIIDRAKGKGFRACAYYPDNWHDVSGGSEHEPSSACLTAMVREFIEEANVDAKCGRAHYNCQIGNWDGVDVEPEEDDNDDTKSTSGGELTLEIIEGLVACISEEEQILLSNVKNAIQLVREQADQICEAEGAECSKGCLKRAFECSKGCLKGALVTKLREGGYNAAICKSKFDHQIKGFSGGGYHYIHVVLEDSRGIEQCLIVDTEFRCQFEIARPTQQYTSILQELPPIFVGKPERLQQMLDLMSVAVKASLRKRRMPLPPWRKAEYMRAKWFSPNKTTTSHQTSRARLLSHGELSCAAMKGFDWDFEFKNKIEVHVGTSDWKQTYKEKNA
ncbi:hypothetical protein O6H91_04G080300 [Diphasiastrum complanatum]|uniref:Uncharacterized protein n=1 Tax=Diphasiastrum complanatum TaxID=34168 RepID=A0ACC2DYM9_DIPCM|nr:hypothetical protein O6H91_04G080300 [Diphasiastrum complanatum]